MSAFKPIQQDKDFGSKLASMSVESNQINSVVGAGHHVKGISEYLNFYENLQESVIERGEHRTPFNQKTRAKPRHQNMLFSNLE
jgi:pheromone shutdown protein TraB